MKIYKFDRAPKIISHFWCTNNLLCPVFSVNNRSFSLLQEIAKSVLLLFAIALKSRISNNYSGSNAENKKLTIQRKKQRDQERQLLLSQRWKNYNEMECKIEISIALLN